MSGTVTAAALNGTLGATTPATVAATTITATSNVGIGTSSPNTFGYGTAVVLTISDPTDNANNRGILELESTKTTPADGDYLGGIAFISKNNTNGKRCANILARASGSTAAHFGGKLEFQTKADNGAEATRLSISSAGLCSFSAGINLGNTVSATATTLDGYEEGVVVAAITCSTSGTVTLNGASDELAYTRIGRMVFVSGYLHVASVSSPVTPLSGYFKITNLPFASAGAPTARISCSVGMHTIVSANIADFWAEMNQNEAFIRVYLGDGTTVQTDSAEQLQAGTSIRVSCAYYTSEAF